MVSTTTKRRTTRTTPFSSKTKPPKLSISTTQGSSPSPSQPPSAPAMAPITIHDLIGHSAYNTHQRSSSNSFLTSPRQQKPHPQHHYDGRNVSIEGIYSDGPRNILPNLYLGSERNAKDIQRIIDLGIGYVLNVAREVVLGAHDSTGSQGENKTQGVQEWFRSLSSPGGNSHKTAPRTQTPRNNSKREEESSGSSDNGSDDSTSPSTINYTTTSKNSSSTTNKQHHQLHPSESTFLASSSSVCNSSGWLTSPSTPTVLPLSPNIAAANSSKQTIHSHASHSGHCRSHSTRTSTLHSTTTNTAVTPTTRIQSSHPYGSSHPSVIYKNLSWSHDEFIIASLPTAFAFIEEARKNNRAVLVNCQQGVSRSASLVIAYVMKSQGMSAWDSYAYVKERAPFISPNISLMSQLVEFEQWCLARGGVE
ncbi:hypothetical protein SeLEV6574_g02100 [Synchytrium endobioticum]|nr:hypothetical protein SeLEV6574_g02100 [Synchytrium endobioticum]